MSTNTQFDPRAWNLLAGVALVSAGCGSRVASQEAGDTGETADTTPDSAEEPECVDSGDCPVGYGCYDGVCMYYPHHDGWTPYYDCYSDSECGPYSICEFGYCTELQPSPDCETLGLEWPLPTAIEVGTEALALTFADVDGDGQDELVVATVDQLLVYESAGADPIASSSTSPAILDMVAGDFDPSPGDDVVLLVDDTLVLRGSNGDGTFAAPIESPLQLGFVNGLFAGQLDEMPSSDLLGWGDAGAFLALQGQVEVFATTPVAAAAVHDLGSANPGIALRRDSFIDVYTLDAELLTSWPDVAVSPLAAFKREFTSDYVFVSAYHDSWSRVRTRNINQSIEEWSIPGTPTHIFAGDLDGTETDELVYVRDGSSAYVHYNPRQDGDCLLRLLPPVRGTPIDAVFGDHDGDGDQELALRTNTADVVLFDGG